MLKQYMFAKGDLGCSKQMAKAAYWLISKGFFLVQRKHSYSTSCCCEEGNTQDICDKSIW